MDLTQAVSYLPRGWFWGGRLQTWHVGALGTMSALIGIYQYFAKKKLKKCWKSRWSIVTHLLLVFCLLKLGTEIKRNFLNWMKIVFFTFLKYYFIYLSLFDPINLIKLSVQNKETTKEKHKEKLWIKINEIKFIFCFFFFTFVLLSLN